MTEIELPPHPAVYSDAVISKMMELVEQYNLRGQLALDPFAGVGQKIDALGLHAIKVELQLGWAKQAQFGAVQADSKHLPFADDTFDVIVSSPVYGNRMSDKHNARDASRRITYRHYLDRTGEELRPENSGGLQWGFKYIALHEAVWTEMTRVAKRHAIFLFNISDHIRAGHRQFVSKWHVEELRKLGWDVLNVKQVETPRMRRGQNHDKRVPGELVFVLELNRKGEVK